MKTSKIETLTLALLLSLVTSGSYNNVHAVTQEPLEYEQKPLGERVQETTQSAADKTKEMGQKAQEKTESAADYLKDKAGEAWEGTKRTASDVKNWLTRSEPAQTTEYSSTATTAKPAGTTDIGKTQTDIGKTENVGLTDYIKNIAERFKTWWYSKPKTYSPSEKGNFPVNPEKVAESEPAPTY